MLRKRLFRMALCACLLCVGCSGFQQRGDEMSDTPTVAIEMKNGGVIEVELNPSAAPLTVENFVKLTRDGFYDGLTFHRIVPGFVIQGGDPNGGGTGGSPDNIKGEFRSNGIENPLKHVRGTISMARSPGKDSASSQFFIVLDDAEHLDGEYAAFGQVISGMDVVDKIASTPSQKSVIKKVTLK